MSPVARGYESIVARHRDRLGDVRPRNAKFHVWLAICEPESANRQRAVAAAQLLLSRCAERKALDTIVAHHRWTVSDGRPWKHPKVGQAKRDGSLCAHRQ